MMETLDLAALLRAKIRKAPHDLGHVRDPNAPIPPTTIRLTRETDAFYRNLAKELDLPVNGLIAMTLKAVMDATLGEPMNDGGSP